MTAARDIDTLLAGLRGALREARSPIAEAALEIMSDKGLAHHHVRLLGTGQLARLPKQSQMGLSAQANLDYETACFERAGPSAHVPRVFGQLEAGRSLPRGGLLVEEVIGRPAWLPQDLAGIAQALAAIHSLPLPQRGLRPPLLSPVDPLVSLRLEIDAQAAFLDDAGLDPAARKLIEGVRDDFRRICAGTARPVPRLIAFDAHPGNFLIRADGTAVLVDLEKARYSYPALDLAHATLYTSTTWDVDTRAELSLAQVVESYLAWESFSDLGSRQRAWYTPLRAAMWLWSVTWCAKWRVLSAAQARASADGEDWSGEHSSGALVRHVRDRVDCYLGVPVITRIARELATLDRAFPT